MRLVEKRVLSTALSTRQPRVLKQVGKPPPCVKGVGALQPARVVGEGSGPGQELQRRDHPRCEGVTETVATVTLEFPPPGMQAGAERPSAPYGLYNAPVVWTVFHSIVMSLT